MKKEKKGLWIGLTLIGTTVLMICDVFSFGPAPVSKNELFLVRYDRPIKGEELTLNQNKYGDYLAGLLARHRQDDVQTTQSFEQALADDPKNEKLKTTVYLLKAVGGPMEQAIELAKELQPVVGPELMTEYVLVADALHRRSYAEAEAILDQKKYYGPDNVLKPALKAWIAAGRGDRASAEKALLPLKSAQLQATYDYYRALLSLIFSDKSAAEKAFRKMSEASERGYPSLTVLPVLRDFYTAQGEWKAGNPDYERIVTFLEGNPPLEGIFNAMSALDKITPETAAAITFYDVSVALSSLKLTETSLLLNEIALYLNPDAAIPKVWGGELMEQIQNYQAANRSYDRLPVQPDVILIKKAINLAADEKYDEALILFQQLATRLSQDAPLFVLMGNTCVKTENWDMAEQSYRRAIALFQKQQNREKASEALFALGAVYDKMKRPEQMEQTLLEAIKMNPNNALALNYLGYVWLDKRKNIDEAFELIKQAAELEPDDPNIMDSLALGYYLKKEYQKALALAEKSIDRLSYSSVAYAHLGDIYSALGRQREAKYQYRKALDLTSDITPELQAELEQKLNRR